MWCMIIITGVIALSLARPLDKLLKPSLSSFDSDLYKDAFDNPTTIPSTAFDVELTTEFEYFTTTELKFETGDEETSTIESTLVGTTKDVSSQELKQIILSNVSATISSSLNDNGDEIDSTTLTSENINDSSIDMISTETPDIDLSNEISHDFKESQKDLEDQNVLEQDIDEIKVSDEKLTTLNPLLISADKNLGHAYSEVFSNYDVTTAEGMIDVSNDISTTLDFINHRYTEVPYSVPDRNLVKEPSSISHQEVSTTSLSSLTDNNNSLQITVNTNSKQSVGTLELPLVEERFGSQEVPSSNSIEAVLLNNTEVIHLLKPEINKIKTDKSIAIQENDKLPETGDKLTTYRSATVLPDGEDKLSEQINQLIEPHNITSFKNSSRQPSELEILASTSFVTPPLDNLQVEEQTTPLPKQETFLKAKNVSLVSNEDINEIIGSSVVAVTPIILDIPYIIQRTIDSGSESSAKSSRPLTRLFSFTVYEHSDKNTKLKHLIDYLRSRRK